MTVRFALFRAWLSTDDFHGLRQSAMDTDICDMFDSLSIGAMPNTMGMKVTFAVLISFTVKPD